MQRFPLTEIDRIGSPRYMRLNQCMCWSYQIQLEAPGGFSFFHPVVVVWVLGHNTAMGSEPENGCPLTFVSYFESVCVT